MSYAEDIAPSVDITGCDTFTQIVDRKLTKGMADDKLMIMEKASVTLLTSRPLICAIKNLVYE